VGTAYHRVPLRLAQQSLGRPAAEDSPLHQALRLDYTPGGPVGGLFLRAERLHSQAGGFGIGRWSDRIANPILERSHGEGFLQVLAGMVAEPGFYCWTNPNLHSHSTAASCC
jgi:predicted ATPase